jgi:hypothetical protein
MTPDERYQAIVAMHRGLDERESLVLSARLILLLAERVDAATLADVMARASAGIAPADGGTGGAGSPAPAVRKP